MLAEGSACTTHSESSVLCAADAVLHTLSLLQEQPEWAAAQVQLQGGAWCPDTTARTATVRQVKSQLASLCRQHVLAKMAVQRVEDILTASPVCFLAALTCMSQVRLNPPGASPGSHVRCCCLVLPHHNHMLCRTTMRCRQYVLNLHAIKLQGHNLLGMIDAGLGLQAAVGSLYVCTCLLPCRAQLLVQPLRQQLCKLHRSFVMKKRWARPMQLPSRPKSKGRN